MFRGYRKRDEYKERPGRAKTSIDEGHVTEMKYLVLKNRRLTIRDLADTISIDSSRFFTKNSNHIVP